MRPHANHVLLLIVYVFGTLFLFVQFLKSPIFRRHNFEEKDDNFWNPQFSMTPSDDSEDSNNSSEPIIPEKCQCKSTVTGKIYNFCYKLPENPKILGKRFSCDFVEEWEKIESSSKFLNLEKQKITDSVFVTAFSNQFVRNGMRLISSIRKLGYRQKIILYNLGIAEDNLRMLKESYRWKPIVIAQVLRDYGSLWYLDSSVIFEKSNVSHVYDLVNCYGKVRKRNHVENTAKIIPRLKSDSEFENALLQVSHQKTSKFRNVRIMAIWVSKYAKFCGDYEQIRKRNSNPKNLQYSFFRPPMLTSYSRDIRENREPHENGWDQKIWEKNLQECRKSQYLLHGYSGHGILSVTHPEVYKYFPTNPGELKKEKAKMYDAGFVFAVNTRQTMMNIVKWYFLCALEEDCMAPKSAVLGCQFVDDDRFRTYAGCHRYDQSIINLVLANQFWYDRRYYVSQIVDFFHIDRAGTPGDFQDKMKCI
ncbi:Protein CBG04378 [Caenorhabditis briggsae]|uniref:Protein CBG04378 n=1 Tax=Caenorhabditis briggsae TaxID=6238 RepID=A8WXE4_CAEBR|nr:Protein CBG04378 [Caenorhabditis briggsae]CAP25095.2 Protein CBG04378 [Caenorhabditis briggsae]